MPAEPAVVFTDAGLFLECAVFVFLLLKSSRRSSSLWFSLFFASLGAAALLGALVHGYFPDETGRGYRILWPATLIGLGVTAFSEWGIASRILWSARAARIVTGAAALLFAAYSAVVLFVSSSFSTAIAHYLPPSVLLFLSFTTLYRRTSSREALMGMVGVGLAFAAAGVQAAEVSPHPVYFNHNALYHLIQAAALAFIFSAARRVDWEKEG